MSPYLLERNHYVPLDIDTTFAFFADAHNVETLTPPWLSFEIVTPDPIEMREGTARLRAARSCAAGVIAALSRPGMTRSPPRR